MSFFSRAALYAAVTSLVTFATTSAPIRAAALAQANLPITPALLTVEPLPVDPATPATDSEPATAPHYDSLADAVAAQDGVVSDEAVRCLASAIYFEAKGEPIAGQLAVAHVVINRSKSGRFPASVCGVVKQPGQFSFVRGGAIPVLDPARPGYRTALGVAKLALTSGWESPAPRALFFHARRVAPGWAYVKVASIGNHIFYR